MFLFYIWCDVLASCFVGMGKRERGKEGRVCGEVCFLFNLGHFFVIIEDVVTIYSDECKKCDMIE